MALPLIMPKTIEVIDGEGKTRSFVISKFDAVEGLEIQFLYPSSLAVAAIPKLGDYKKISEPLMFKILNYVAVDIKGTHLRLSTRELVVNHLGDWEALLKVIWEVMQYNSSFLRDGTLYDFLIGVAKNMLVKISEIYTQSSAPSSPPDSPPSTNSEPSTA